MRTASCRQGPKLSGAIIGLPPFSPYLREKVDTLSPRHVTFIKVAQVRATAAGNNCFRRDLLAFRSQDFHDRISNALTGISLSILADIKRQDRTM